MLVRIAWPIANAGPLAEDEWVITAFEIDPDGRPGRGHFGLPPIGSIPECGLLRGNGQTGCIECGRLASFLDPGDSADCVVRFTMPTTVQSGLVLIDTEHGDRSVTRFTIGPVGTRRRAAPN